MKKNSVKLTALLLVLFPSLGFAEEAVVNSSQPQESIVREQSETEQTSASSDIILSEQEEATQTSESLTTTETSEVKEKAITKVEEADDIAKKEVENKYVTVTNSNEKIWQEIEKESNSTTEKLVNQTFSVKEIATTKEGKIYFLLYGKENNVIGYIAKEAVEEAKGEQGIAQSNNQFVALKDKSVPIYRNFSWEMKKVPNTIFDETLHVKVIYRHFNGKTYYSLYDNKNNWHGYVEDKDVNIGDGRQGPWLKLDKYVTVSKKNYSLWGSFNWKEKNNTSNLMNKTVHAQGYYRHFNGSIYYSLYDNNGTWLGYVNKNAVTDTTGRQGPWIKTSKYVTISNKNYPTYSNFNWKVRHNASSLLNKTFKVTGRYEHMNGSTYYSLYDTNNKWFGYINKNAVKEGSGRQGAFISSNNFASITKSNYSVWQNFNWKKKNSSSNLFNKTFQIKGYYQHMNGDIYYSLYDNKGNWQGYINSNAATIAEGRQGIYIRDGRTLKVVNGNYDVWQNFNWVKKTSSKNYLNQSFVMRGRYQHFNGSTYYSMYDTSGNWKGYLNANATATPVTSRVIDSVPYVSQYTPVFAPWGCAGASMTMALRSKGVSVDLRYAMDNMPMYPQYPGGQIGKSVYTGEGFKRVIQPQELTNYMKRWYPKVYNISGASSQIIINHILEGNPVLYYGYSSYQVDNARNHVKVILGYKNNSFLIYDPLYYSKFAGAGTAGKHPIYDRGAMHWLSVSDFNKEYGGSAIVTK
ncbi:C39 family peptidase [Vagococcus carniphilus]|uniref:C39 family peptidase n=1 Tax=Vagococcus carniphilus TaxID=218144 RepID=UPI0028906B80|nr:C39 family peptidase [Vagococcus carniphilus]MDT2848748.1 C39 family peptidase [Vagococcus carniphilus]